MDQDGRPLNVARWAGEEHRGHRVSTTYPWLNGERRLYNVFPPPVRDHDVYRSGTRLQPDAWTSTNPPHLPGAPLGVVPPVSLPLKHADGADRAPQPDEGGR
ncbi:MAG TPA: hypothetical protein VFR87_05810 [Nocardioidaceae bacterium]|nr:hypothetical protein [Nocardioidaceae bacterium]